ncbi:MAG: hypothetical protein GF350_04900, partial [Chitinivibrionales bacterium]|nr:hypothetical protein [Chitinivibrionales bacterium]
MDSPERRKSEGNSLSDIRAGMFILSILVSAIAVRAIPVFPGAQGFGVHTPGGRGGKVITVTNLDADGPGSFKAALEESGPRIIVFEVGGIIDIPGSVVLTEPFVTVAGESAPSPGITIIGATLWVETHDVVFRHIRIRTGDRVEG